MAEYLSPGVYMEEIDSGPKPIEGVSTSTAAFVGFTARSNGGKAQLVTSWGQYEKIFGGFAEGAYLPYSVYGFFQNGGQRCYIISINEMSKAQAKLFDNKLIVDAKQAGLGGKRLRFKLKTADVSSEERKRISAAATKAKKAADAAAKTLTETEKALSQAKIELSKAKAEEKSKVEEKVKAAEEKVESAQKEAATAKERSLEAETKAEEILNPPFTMHIEQEQADNKWKEVEILKDVRLEEVEVEEDGSKKKKIGIAYKYNRASEWIDIETPAEKPNLATLENWQYLELEPEKLPVPEVKEFRGNERERTGLGSLSALDDVSIVCVPDIMSVPPGQEGPNKRMVKALQDAIVTHCELMGDRVAILDPLPGLSPMEMKEWRMNDMPDSSYAAVYYPWLEIMDPIQSRPILIPPSGHVAGIWSRTDTTRGVHKAPANETIRGITGLKFNATKGEQDILNPNGINVLRAFPGRGTRVWGARTLSSNPSWRYLNVRRLFNYVEKSIEQSTQWVVFEPNDPDLWARVTRDVTAFLKTVWRDGALFGLSESDAFYVKCDAELNPPESRDQGKLIIEIGLAPVKPAEFVIFRIMQKSETV